jgi:glycerol-3-phosphate dehydrogenase
VRGEYAEVNRSRAYLVNSLVYPLPRHDLLSLGVHLTRTVWGTVLVGPTADYVKDKNDYESNRLPLEQFFTSARKLLPELQPEDLQLAYSGLRPKLVPPGSHESADFIITRDPHWPRIIHLVGIESPGLTAAPAIACDVSAMVADTLS